MNRDSRLSGVLHILLHMAEQDGPVTSDQLARIMQTNPVVVRRLMAGLRDRDYVRSEKGHGGGWTIARDLATISLRDIYEAIGSPPLFAIGHRSDAPHCAVEQAVNHVLGDRLRETEQALLASFGAVTLAALSAGFHDHLSARPKHHEGHGHAG